MRDRGGAKVVQTVAGDAEAHGLAAGERDLGGEAVTIGVADLVGQWGGVDLDQLVAGGEDGDAGTREDLDLGSADCGEGSDMGGGEARAGGDEPIALARFAAGWNDVAAGADLAVWLEADASVHGFDVFEHNDRVRSCRERRAGHDLQCGAGFERCGGGRLAGAEDAGDREPVATGECGGLNSVAIAGGAVEGREVAIGADGLCENAMDGVEERDLLGATHCVLEARRWACSRTRFGGFGVSEDGDCHGLIVRRPPRA